MKVSLDKEKLKRFILFLQKKINEICLSTHTNKFSVKFNQKKKYDIVTKLDIKIENILRKKIHKKYPLHNVKGEELKEYKSNSKYTWFIDPIDGTKNMILGLPTWSNMISIFEEDKAICSLINYPLMNRFYLSYKNKTFLYEGKRVKIIKSSKISELKKAKIAVNTFHTMKNKYLSKFINNFNGFFRITGADSFNFCLIAEGKLDILIEDKLKLIDIMPVISIIENSGAVISDWNGKKNFKSGKVLVASNKLLFKKIFKKIK